MEDETMSAQKPVPLRILKFWLDVMFALAGAATVILGLWLLISPFAVPNSRSGGDVTVEVAIGERTFLPVLDLRASPEAGTSEPELYSPKLVKAHGELRLLTRSWGLHVLTMGPILIFSVVILWAIWLVRGFLASVLAGEPFAAANSRRLRLIGLITVTAALLAPVIDYFTAREVLSRISIEGIALQPAFTFSQDALIVGLLFLGLSMVFRHGTELEEEQTLTI
jgi:hypothetical protein